MMKPIKDYFVYRDDLRSIFRSSPDTVKGELRAVPMEQIRHMIRHILVLIASLIQPPFPCGGDQEKLRYLNTGECCQIILPLAHRYLKLGKGQYDLVSFTGIQVTQLFMITAAGKWGLYQGSGRNQYMSYHMADLLHGYGAQLTFDGIWRGPEYGPEIITIDKVIFYRFRHFLLWDHVPESLVCAPEELPARFVSTAMTAFQGIIGKGKKKE